MTFENTIYSKWFIIHLWCTIHILMSKEKSILKFVFFFYHHLSRERRNYIVKEEKFSNDGIQNCIKKRHIMIVFGDYVCMHLL